MKKISRRVSIALTLASVFGAGLLVSTEGQARPKKVKGARALDCPDAPGDGVLPPEGDVPPDSFKVGFVSLKGGRPQPVIYTERDGMAILQGDIIIGTATQMRSMSQSRGKFGAESAVVSDPSLRWPGAIVPYEIDPALGSQGRILAGITDWQAAGIQFVPHQSETDYVFITVGTGCDSAVGKQGGRQVIHLADGCSAGNTIHEMGHTIGLLHEHNRSDRDQFITLNWSNIPIGWQSQFQLMNPATAQTVGPYDFCSIMHYPALAGGYNNGQQPVYDFVNQCPACVPGKVTDPSAGDISAVKQMYGISSKAPASKR